MIKEISSPQMISVDDKLPPTFTNVLVYGLCKYHDEINYGYYIARRFKNDYQSDNYSWLTNLDMLVKPVLFWMLIPTMGINQNASLTERRE